MWDNFPVSGTPSQPGQSPVAAAPSAKGTPWQSIAVTSPLIGPVLHQPAAITDWHQTRAKRQSRTKWRERLRKGKFRVGRLKIAQSAHLLGVIRTLQSSLARDSFEGCTQSTVAKSPHNEPEPSLITRPQASSARPSRWPSGPTCTRG